MLYVFDTVGKSKYHVGKDAQGFNMDLTTDKDPMVQVAGITEDKNNMYTPYYGKKSAVPHSYFSRVVKDSLSTFVVSDTLGIPADGYGEYVTSVVTDEEGNKHIAATAVEGDMYTMMNGETFKVTDPTDVVSSASPDEAIFITPDELKRSVEEFCGLETTHPDGYGDVYVMKVSYRNGDLQSVSLHLPKGGTLVNENLEYVNPIKLRWEEQPKDARMKYLGNLSSVLYSDAEMEERAGIPRLTDLLETLKADYDRSQEENRLRELQRKQEEKAKATQKGEEGKFFRMRAAAKKKKAKREKDDVDAFLNSAAYRFNQMLKQGK